MSLKPNTKYKNICLLTLVGLFNLLDGIGPHYLENNGQIRLHRLLWLTYFIERN